MKKAWKLGMVLVVALAVAGAAVGFVAAQTPGDSTPSATATSTEEANATATTESSAPTERTAEATATPKDSAAATPAVEDTLRDRFLDGLAEQLGVSREQLDQAISDSALALVDQAVADGRISEDEAAHIRELIAAGEFPPFFGPRGHHGHGPCPGANLEDLAGFLGVEPSVVRDGLENGQSLAQIAEANGKSRDELKSFLLSNITEKVNQAVADGDLTQDRADEILANAPDHIDELIDREGLPERGRFRPMPGGGLVEPAPEDAGVFF